MESPTAVLLYFSHKQCGVCTVLKPKVQKLIKEKFPLMVFKEVNIIEKPEEAAQKQVFSAPTIIVELNNKESFRYTRNLGLQQLEKDISRAYKLLFE